MERNQRKERVTKQESGDKVEYVSSWLYSADLVKNSL